MPQPRPNSDGGTLQHLGPGPVKINRNTFPRHHGHLLSEQPFATAPFQFCGCFGCRGSVAAVILFPDYFNRSTGLGQNEERHHGTNSSHIKTSTLKRGGVDGKHSDEATDEDSGLL